MRLVDFCKITDTNSNQRLIKKLQVCISVNFVFICSILSAGGEFKMLYFQVACAQKFQTKNDFFCAARKYGMSLSICKNFRKNDT